VIQNKKALENNSNAFMVEHLEKSSPLIVEEIARWHDLLWDDYLYHKHSKASSRMLSNG